jgi:hypothetical protein
MNLNFFSIPKTSVFGFPKNQKIEGWRWKWFQPHEVLNKEGYNLLMTKGILLINPRLLDEADKFREVLHSPLYCNYGSENLRGLRSWEEEQAIYKKRKQPAPKFSQHIFGNAIDVHSRDISPYELFLIAQKFGFTGIGLYDWGLHLDVRTIIKGEEKHIWDLTTKKK